MDNLITKQVIIHASHHVKHKYYFKYHHTTIIIIMYVECKHFTGAYGRHSGFGGPQRLNGIDMYGKIQFLWRNYKI